MDYSSLCQAKISFSLLFEMFVKLQVYSKVKVKVLATFETKGCKAISCGLEPEETTSHLYPALD